MNKLDNIMKKAKEHKNFTDEEYDYLYNKLNALYGDNYTKDELPEEIWPFNLLSLLFGNDDFIYGTEQDIKELEERIQYVFEHHLTAREATILELRLKNKMTLDKVAEKLEITRERVRQIETKAIRKMHHPFRKELLFVPNKLKDEVEQRQKTYKNESKELGEMITRTINNINILSDALNKIGVETITNTKVCNLDRNIDEFNLSIRSYNCLKRAGINTIRQITERSKKDICNIRNMGRHSVEEIEELLTTLGYTFSPTDYDELAKTLESSYEEEDINICKYCCKFNGDGKKCDAGYVTAYNVESCLSFESAHP